MVKEPLKVSLQTIKSMLRSQEASRNLTRSELETLVKLGALSSIFPYPGFSSQGESSMLKATKMLILRQISRCLMALQR